MSDNMQILRGWLPTRAVQADSTHGLLSMCPHMEKDVLQSVHKPWVRSKDLNSKREGHHT